MAAAAPIIKEIDIRPVGGARIADGVVLANMATAVGDALEHTVLDEDLKRLYASGLIDNVDFLQEPLDGGVRLIVMVEARGKLRDVLFLGNTTISTKKLRHRVELTPNQTWDDTAIQQARQEIVRLYTKAGYADVDVQHSTAPAGDGFMRITFAIDEGQRTVLDRIVFEGNRVFRDRELAGRMKTRERKLLRVFGENSRIDNRVLEDDVVAIENHYRDAGYVEMRVTEIGRHTTGKTDHYDLVLTIDEGSQHKVASVRITGTSAIAEETTLSKLLTRSGLPFSAKAVREDIGFLRNFYGRRGYLNLHVRPILTSAGEAALDVEFSVYEGVAFKVGTIDFSGNEETRDRVLRRELAVLPGESFNTSLLQASTDRLRQLPNFSRVGASTLDSPEEGYKDVRITVTEQPTGEIRFGAGFSSVDNIVGFISYQQRNFDITGWPKFTGAGQKFRANLQYGAERRDFEIGFTEPWLFGHDLEMSTGASYRDIFYNSDFYDERHAGGKLAFRKKVGEHSSLAGGYKLDFGKIHHIDPAASDAIKSEEGEFIDSMVFAEYNLTTIDDFSFPRSGHRLNVRTEFSGLGGDVNTYAVEFGAAKYFHLPLDTVFHVEGLFRTIDSHGTGNVPIYKREFLGSAHNLRGYEYRGVGPKDENGEPLGGGSSLFITTELSTPLPGKLGERLRPSRLHRRRHRRTRRVGTRQYLRRRRHRRQILPEKNRPPLRFDYAIPLKTDRHTGSGGRLNVQMGIKF